LGAIATSNTTTTDEEEPKEQSPVSQELMEFESKVKKEGLLQSDAIKLEAHVEAEAEDHAVLKLEPAMTEAGDSTSEIKEEKTEPELETTPPDLTDQPASEELEHPGLQHEPPLPEVGNTSPMPGAYSSYPPHDGAMSYPPYSDGRSPYSSRYMPYPPPPPPGYYPPYGYAPSSPYASKDDKDSVHHPSYHYSYPPPPYYSGYHPYSPYYGGLPTHPVEAKPPAPDPPVGTEEKTDSDEKDDEGDEVKLEEGQTKEEATAESKCLSR
jgi:hypothetical protein